MFKSNLTLPQVLPFLILTRDSLSLYTSVKPSLTVSAMTLVLTFVIAWLEARAEIKN